MSSVFERTPQGGVLCFFFVAVTFLEKTVQLPGITYASEGDPHAVVESYGVVTTRKLTPGSEIMRLVRGESSFLSKFGLEVSEHKNWKRELDGLAMQVAF